MHNNWTLKFDHMLFIIYPEPDAKLTRCYLYYSNDMTMDDGSSMVIAVANVKDYSY